VLALLRYCILSIEPPDWSHRPSFDCAASESGRELGMMRRMTAVAQGSLTLRQSSSNAPVKPISFLYR
jgi:hypothetical protein